MLSGGSREYFGGTVSYQQIISEIMPIERIKVFTELSGTLPAKIEFIQPNIYQNISSDVGVFTPGVGYSPSLRLSSSELRLNGVIVKLNARTESGKNTSVYCNSAKLSTALPALVGKLIPEQIGSEVVFKKIVKVSIPRKRSRG
jgi:hypothetical protein